ncbi:hypothetical protein [Streptomyces sp. Caat 7-52]|uniref:hypothetical protein n=1 Tax=Streptomyces sp. Caat 7-52 TaxID=2949637 RepID=UPI00203606F1|nr:hypothetical protein [Streptomyces sp. Caat 7-52]
MNHTYEPPSLLPAGGRERTYALLIAGIPLLLILLMGVAPHLSSDSDDGSGDPAAGYGGGSSQNYAPPVTYSPAPETPTFPGTEPSVPTGTDDTTGTGEPTDPETGPTGTETTVGTTDGTAGPAETVTHFFDAVNRGDYDTAWELGGRNLDPSYTSFVSGFDTTRHDDVTIRSVEGRTVSVDLIATQTDGTRKSFSGVYTVVDGVITHASMTSSD